MGIRRRRGKRSTAPAGGGRESGRDGKTGLGGGLPDLENAWHSRDEEMEAASFGAMARGLPGLFRQALGWAYRASPWDATATIVLTVASGVMTAVGLLATTNVLTPLFAAGPTPDRVWAALPALVVVGVAAMVRSLLSAGAGWAQARLEPAVEEVVGRRLFEQTTRVGLAAYDDPDFYETLERARDRGVREGANMVTGIADLGTGLAGLAAVASVLGVLHPVLLLLLLLAVLPEGWAVFRTARQRYAMWRQISRSLRRRFILSGMMADRHSAAEVRSFGMRDYLLAEYDTTSGHEVGAYQTLARRQALTKITGDAMGGIGKLLVYAALGWMLLNGLTPLAVAGTAVLAIQAGSSNLGQILYAFNRGYESGLYIADVVEFHRRATDWIPPVAARPNESLNHLEEIRAENITFAYPGEDRNALDGVDVTIRAGETIALVGENGSGKTTLAKILTGLYRPGSGRVTWDGTDLADIAPETVWGRVTVISQDYTRWPMNARTNVTMGPHLNAAAFDRATTISGANEVIADLDDGWDALLDKRFKDGRELSGGQWQRLAIARGLYKPGTVLICDEPTAALDARAEHAMFDAIRTHATGHTTILITHRLASVRFANRIYVLDKGRVVEHGTHHALLDTGGRYAELYGLQANAYHPGTEPAAEHGAAGNGAV